MDCNTASERGRQGMLLSGGVDTVIAECHFTLCCVVEVREDGGGIRVGLGRSGGTSSGKVVCGCLGVLLGGADKSTFNSALLVGSLSCRACGGEPARQAAKGGRSGWEVVVAGRELDITLCSTLLFVQSLPLAALRPVFMERGVRAMAEDERRHRCAESTCLGYPT